MARARVLLRENSLEVEIMDLPWEVWGEMRVPKKKAQKQRGSKATAKA